MHPESTSISLFDGKRCKRCCYWHPYTSFYFRERGGWYESQCKRCFLLSCSEAQARRLQADPVRVRLKNLERQNRYAAKPESIEKRRARHREWYKRNKDKNYEFTRRRRVLARNSSGKHTIQQWKELCAFYGGKCLCCGEIKKLTRDHIVALTIGGSDDISNIQPLCQVCNTRKQTKIIDYRPVILTIEEIP